MSEKSKKSKPVKNQKEQNKIGKKQLESDAKMGGELIDLLDIPLNLSSSELVRNPDKTKDTVSRTKDRGVAADEASAPVELEVDGEAIDPIFKQLSEPSLPELPKENRARLQMQSPTRLYFYWSVKNNPFQILTKVLGGQTGSYSLVAKLINRTKKTEDLFPVDPEGNWWFNVDSDSDYRAEIGFYAPNRPFIRVMFSNEIHTPRRSPSKRTDYTPSFTVNAYQFAEVLDASGYRRDAIEVAVAGDDTESAESATRQTYRQLAGKSVVDFESSRGEELRFVFLALASGYSLDDIQNQIDPSLFAKLQRDFKSVTADEVRSALESYFDVFSEEIFEHEEIGSAVYGASLVNFPKRIRKKNVPQGLLPKLTDLKKPESLSSFGLKQN